MKEMNVRKNLTNEEFKEFKNNLPTAEEASVIMEALQETIKAKIGNLSYILAIETKEGVSFFAEASGNGMINSAKATINAMEKAGVSREQIYRDLFPERALGEIKMLTEVLNIKEMLEDFMDLREDVTKN